MHARIIKLTLMIGALNLIGACESPKPKDEPVKQPRETVEPDPRRIHDFSEGKYIGWKPSPDVVDDPQGPWYAQHTLQIIGNSISIESAPRGFTKGQVYASASTGGFYTYAGTIEKRGMEFFVKLKTEKCDYCPKPIDSKNPELTHKIIANSPYALEIDKVRYTLLF